MRKLFIWAVLVVLSFSGVGLADSAGRVISVDKQWLKPVYTVKCENGIDMRISFYRADVFRIEAAPDGDYADPKNDPEKAQIVIEDDFGKFNIEFRRENGVYTFRTDSVVLHLNEADSRFELLDSNGNRLWKENKPLYFDKKKTVQTLSSRIDEQFFGGGQQNGYFTHKGRKISIRADGNWNEGGHPNPAPFYMSNKGYAVLRNTFAVGSYDFTNPKEIKLQHNEKRFDAYYFVGASLNRMLDLYTQFSGRPNFVAIWALEMGDADCYMTRDKKTKKLVRNEKGEFVEITDYCVKRVARKYREYDMPLGWMLVNDGYGCGYTNLIKVAESMARLGVHTGLWTEKGLAKTKWEVGTAGVRVQKLDVAWTGPAYQFSLDANRQAWESLVHNSDSRGFVWTVQGWAGTQRYSVCWTGDQYGSWDLIRYHIPTLIGSGLSGQAYATTDVDGIFGGSPETYTRDLQWKCFTPVLYAMNGWSRMPKSPWKYEEPYRSINRKYLKLKMRLVPYLYHYTHEAWQTGAPIVRGMVWEYPTDPKTWDTTTQHQYLLGEYLLVAPVYTSMKLNKGWRKEDIYLPRGRWFDYWDGRIIDGPTTIDAYPITLDKLPILVRGGAIIPMYPEMLYNNQKPKDPLTFDCYPFGKSKFELYEDDGETRRYQKGEFALQLIKMDAPRKGSGDITINIGKSEGKFDGKLDSRIYKLKIHTPFKPESVLLDGNPLPYEEADQTIVEVDGGWQYHSGEYNGVLFVQLPRRELSEAAEIVVKVPSGLPEVTPKPYPVPEVTPDLDPCEFVVSVNSENRGSSIRNAFDGTAETIWHSKFGKHGDKPPYIVKIDLGTMRALNGFSYLPRQSGVNGKIADFELYAGRTFGSLKQPVYKGKFTNTTNLCEVSFPTVWARVVELKILSEVNGNDFASAAEFELKQDLAAKPLDAEVKYLSDMKPASEKGVWRNDLSAGGKKLAVNGQVYKKGIGAISGSVLVYKLDGTWDRLMGHVGMDDEVGDGGSIMFRVYGDGKLLFESPEMTGRNVKQLLALSIRNIKELRLVLLDQGDGSDNDHGDWVDLKLIRNGSE